jgi:hypothetical protein
MLDQPHNAKTLVKLGVASGGIVPYAKLTSKNLAGAIGKVLANENGCKEVAEKWGKFVRDESEGNGGRYVERIVKSHDQQINDAALRSYWGVKV